MRHNGYRDRGISAGTGYYYAGMAGAIAVIAAAQLIWLPAPLETAGGMQWIEMIDWLLLTIAFIPLMWGIGAYVRTRAKESPRWLNALRMLLAVLAFGTACYIVIAPGRFLEQIVLLVILCILQLTEMIVSETREGGRHRVPRRSIAVLLAFAMLLAVLLWPTGYRVTYPGMTVNMQRYAHVEGGEEGSVVDGVLVFERPAVAADWLYAKLFPLYRFERIPDNEPPLTETFAEVVAMKRSANDVAAAIAMEKAGIGKGVVPEGVRIVAVTKGSPAEGRLRAGDVIVGLDGKPVQRMEELAAYMLEAVKPGQIVYIDVVRSGTREEAIEVPTVEAVDDGGKRAVMGISIEPDVRLDKPREMTYESYIAHLGGPSHGAMLTLAIYEQLTGDSVSQGLRVAGTGTIEYDGSIGMVGGIPQKAYAVSRTGADVFFVPSAGAEAARNAAPDLNVVAVDTFDEVLDWLEQYGK
ncbi:PDZ domain-containing protein [Paenibacillus sp. J5C_2022]|uniref:PDZ domain-containing protein n=1 Tax=Paenibacillus sp. J5C2022 TaxID=2977129 RepID=UPI0021CE5D10|nr:PDZ domain-containing protein [Paenibacillus sp. J5C2022]MCU6707576.1 PDZ domain-containing protein [Paenibacillus sp. J5C2022]